MSLLLSTHTNKNKQKLAFMQNSKAKNQNQSRNNIKSGVQRYYINKSNRKSHEYSNSNQINSSLNSKSQTQRIQFNINSSNGNKNNYQIQFNKILQINKQIQTLFKKFSDDIQGVVKQCFDKIDYSYFVAIMKNIQFFNHIINFFNADLLKEKSDLEKNLSQSKQISKYWKKQYKKISQKKQFNKQLSHNNSPGWRQSNFANTQQTLKNKYISIETSLIGRKIFQKAKTLPEDQFIQFYDSIALSNKIQIKNIIGDRDIKVYLKEKDIRGNKKKKDNSINQQFIDKLNKLFNLSQNFENEQKKDEINSIFKQLAQIIQKQLAELHFCKQPCCKRQQQQIDQRPNKAKYLIKSSQKSLKYKNNIYKSDKSQQYFQRYYRRNKSFEIDKITSIQKTKLIEMEQLQNQYWKNYEKRSRPKGISKRYGQKYNLGSVSYDHQM